MATIKTHYITVRTLADLERPFIDKLHEIYTHKEREKALDELAKGYEAKYSKVSSNTEPYPTIIYQDEKYYVIEGGKRYPYSKYPWHLVPDQKMFLYNDFIYLYDKKTRGFKPYIKTLPEVVVTAKGINSQLEDVRYKLAGTAHVYSQIQLYSSLLSSSSMSIRGSGFGSMMAANDLLEVINTDLKKFGFENLTEYENTQNDFLRYIKIKAHRFIDKHFSQYAKSLNEEKERLSNKEYIQQLYQKLASSNAHQYHKGSQQRLSAAQTFNKTGNLSVEKQKIETYKQGEKKQAIAKEDIDCLGLFLTQSPDFDYDALSRVTSEQEMIVALKNEIKKQRDNIKASREYLFEGDTIFEFSEIIAQVLQQENINEGSILFTMVMDKIKSEAFNKVLHGLAIAVFAIAVGLLTAGTGTIAILGAATVAAAGAYVTYEEIKDYRGKLATYNINLSDNEPSIVWVIVSIVGTVLDVAAFTKIASSLMTAGRVFDKTGDIVTLEKSLAKLEGVTEKMQKNILRQARIDKKYKEVLKMNGMLSIVSLEQLYIKGGEIAYYLVLKGITRFDEFLLELKVQKIIGETSNLSPEQVKVLKNAFAKVEKLTDTKIKDLVKEKLIKKLSFNPKEYESVIRQLSKEPGGKKLAQKIVSGKYENYDGYKDLVSSLKQPDNLNVQKVTDAFDVADDFKKSGLDDIFFERTTAKYGYDADVGAISANSDIPSVVVQLKLVTSNRKIFPNLLKGFEQLQKAPKLYKRIIDIKIQNITYKEFASTNREKTLFSRLIELNKDFGKTEVRISFKDNITKVY